MRFGADVSNYQKQLSYEDCLKLVIKQCSFIAIGRQWSNARAERQWINARAAGIPNVIEYLESVNGWPELFPETKYVAIAVEKDSGFTNEWEIDNAIRWIRSQGRTPMIYTSNYMWNLLGLQAITKYGEQGVLLWDANYDGVTNGFELPIPFGGWTRCVIDQYTDEWADGAIGYPLDMNDAEDWLFDPAAALPVITLNFKALDSSESLVALEAVAHNFGAASNDNSVTIAEITGGLPPDLQRYVPEGGHAYLFTTKP